MKKKLVLIALLSLIIIYIYMFFFMPKVFLNVEIISHEELENKISNLSVSEDNLVTQLRFEGVTPAYDNSFNYYYITVGKEIKGNFIENENLEVYWIDDSQFEDIEKSISENEDFNIVIIRDNSYTISTIKITTLPIVQLTTPIEPIPYSDLKNEGHLLLVDPDFSVDGRYSYENYAITYKYRGSNTQLYPKKSYNIDLIDSDKENYDHVLLGVRSDDDWALTAVYGDTTKVREAIMMDLIGQIKSEQNGYYLYPQGIEFCELFLNNQYIGIYQLLEPMDEKQIQIDRDTDFLYKIIGEQMPSIEELKANDSSSLLYTIEAKHYPPNENVYEPMIEFFDLFSFDEATQRAVTLDEVTSKFDIYNLIDNDILIRTFGLMDNEPKNMFLSVKESGNDTIFEYILYDMNYSLGDQYIDNSSTFTANMDSSVTEYSYISDVLLHSEDRSEYIMLFTERYSELRTTVLTNENIIETINKHVLRLSASGAYIRDSLVWWSEDDLQEELDRLIDYSLERLMIMDHYVEGLSNE